MKLYHVNIVKWDYDNGLQLDFDFRDSNGGRYRNWVRFLPGIDDLQDIAIRLSEFADKLEAKSQRLLLKRLQGDAIDPRNYPLDGAEERLAIEPLKAEDGLGGDEAIPLDDKAIERLTS